MANFRLFSQSDILSYVKKREGETKLGEKITFYPEEKLTLVGLKGIRAKYVLLGIPEDIGVRANIGIGGAATAWNAALNSFLNMQQNPFLDGENVLLLGEFDIDLLIGADIQTLRKAVEQLDNVVAPIISLIIEAGKIPIIIGGGHNNAYPIIKGLAKAKKQKVDVLNIDAHSDLRSTAEGRHSGNGFSTAIENDYLGQYRIFGLHKAYISQSQLDFIHKHQVSTVYFDDILANELSIIQNANLLVKDLKTPFGLEIDMDSIAGMLSSASSSSGFHFDDIRQLVKNFAQQTSYIHLCEAALQLTDGRTNALTGKSIAYLIADFVGKTAILNHKI